MPTRRVPDSQPISPEEARKRLGAAYSFLLSLAASRRMQAAAQTMAAMAPSTDHEVTTTSDIEGLVTGATVLRPPTATTEARP